MGDSSTIHGSLMILSRITLIIKGRWFINNRYRGICFKSRLWISPFRYIKHKLPLNSDQLFTLNYANQIPIVNAYVE